MMDELSKNLKEMAHTLGAFKVGITTTKTLAGGPPSTDLTYILPTAKSAVTFAVAFDQNLIEPYFKKEDHKALETNKVRTTTLANGIALEIAEFAKPPRNKTCEHCGTVFSASRRTQKFCKTRCRVAAHRDQKRREAGVP